MKDPYPPGCTHIIEVWLQLYRCNRKTTPHSTFFCNCNFNQFHLINSKTKSVLNCRLAIAIQCVLRWEEKKSYNPGSAGVAEIKIHLLKAVLRMGKERVDRGGYGKKKKKKKKHNGHGRCFCIRQHSSVLFPPSIPLFTVSTSHSPSLLPVCP